LGGFFARESRSAFADGDAVEPPGGVGEFLDELGPRCGLGFVLVEKMGAVTRVLRGALGREDRGPAGEAGAVFAGFNAWAGGVLRVGAVGGGAAG